MHARLNETAKEALQFLTLGSGIVLALRLAYLGVAHLLGDRSADPLTIIAVAFGRGYLLADANTLVVLGMNVGGRMALAFIVALLNGLLMAILGILLARVFKYSTLSMAVGLGRVGLLVGGAWGLFAAFALPPKTTAVDERGLTFRERPAILNEISWPYPSRTNSISWSSINAIEARTIANHAVGCGSLEVVVAVMDGTTKIVAGIVPEGRDCNDALHEARSYTEQLAQVLEDRRKRFSGTGQ